ncbi:MAG: transposase [Methylococcaceae bacterium]
MKKDCLHNPTHIFVDDAIYFLTSAIYMKKPLLESTEIKWYLLQVMKSAFERFSWEFQHWVILDNHYHVLAKSRRGDDLPKIIKNIHGVSGFHLKRLTQAQNPIWWNYWDYCPRDEKDYLRHLNYLFNNPIKHGYVTDLKNYPFSSFHQYFEKQGREKLVEQFKAHPDYKDLRLVEDDL